MRAWTVPIVVGACVMAGSRVSAQCDTVSSVTSLSAFSGARIGAVHIRTADPPAFPGVGAALGVLHVRTRDRTIRRQLRFAAGDTVDTLAVGESIRRLRSDRYLRDVTLTGVRCGKDAVDLVLTTRDEWSVKPKVQIRGSGRSELAITERNLVGSGRELSLHVRSQQGRLGIGVRLDDPWFLGSRFSAVLGQDTYREGRDWMVTVRLREETVLAPWGVELGGLVSSYRPPRIGTDQFERASLHLLVRRRLFETPSAVVSLLGGAESEHAELRAGVGAPIVGPSRVTRDFYGASVGATRASVGYDTLTWMMPNDAVVDVPLAFEAEGVAAAGRDVAGGVAALHIDVWTGKAWLPSHRSLLVSDVWGSGYLAAGQWDAVALRAGLGYYHAAARGVWSARLSAERLVDPDPDVRTFASADPTARLLPDGRRLAEAAVALTAERDVRLRPLSRSWMLDGALFAAASSRWESVAPSPEHVNVGVLGLGLRLAPTRAGRATARLDFGFPVVGSALARRGPYVSFGLSPWWGDGRRRVGRPE